MNKFSNSYTVIVRIALSLACFGFTGVFFFGDPDWIVNRLYGINWGNWMSPILLVFGIQLLLPLLLPWWKWFIAGSTLYVVFWAVVWYLYSSEVSRDINVDSRGTTGGLFLFSNYAFVAGVVLRLLARIVRQIYRNFGLSMESLPR